jgi:hypothetical protein
MDEPKMQQTNSAPKGADYFPCSEHLSPLYLCFHYDDPLRRERLLGIDGDRLLVTTETPESLQQYLALTGLCGTREKGGSGSSLKLALIWTESLALLRHADWKTIPFEDRIPVYFSAFGQWVVDGWKAIDRGILDSNLIPRPLLDEELREFRLEPTAGIDEIAAAVMTQYKADIGRLAETRPTLARVLSGQLGSWVAPALTSLPALQQREGFAFGVEDSLLFRRAYQLMCIGESPIDPITGRHDDIRIDANGNVVVTLPYPNGGDKKGD